MKPSCWEETCAWKHCWIVVGVLPKINGGMVIDTMFPWMLSPELVPGMGESPGGNRSWIVRLVLDVTLAPSEAMKPCQSVAEELMGNQSPLFSVAMVLGLP